MKNGMKNETMFDGITGMKEELIERAENYSFGEKKKRKKGVAVKWLALAACLCLVVGVSVQFLLPRGSCYNGGNEYQPGNGYMSYAGPAFSLNVLSDAAGIVAEREIVFDFSPYETRMITEKVGEEEKTYNQFRTESLVTDNYRLNNTTEEDITVTVSYPFVGSLRYAHEYVPTIWVNGEVMETELAAGQVLVHTATDWEDYQELLLDGSYLAKAYADAPELLETVIVYRVSNMAYHGNDKKATNPTLSLEFVADYEKTRLFSFGIGGFSRNVVTGESKQHTSVPKAGDYNYDTPRYLVVLGEDIKELELQGYRDGGCEDGEEIDGVTAKVERLEVPLEELLWDFYRMQWENHDYLGEGRSEFVTDELMFDTMKKFMQESGILSDSVSRGAWGRYEDMWSGNYLQNRVLYVSFDVTIPAQGSVQVEASMKKEASIDFDGAGRDRNGFDLVTGLGSNLEFSRQTASIKNLEFVELLGQNFGFDPANEVTQVELDLNEPHYYIEVQRKMDE